VWRGAPKARYTGWCGATGSNLGIFQRLRCVGIYLVFSILFLIKINILLAWKNSKKTWIVFVLSFFSFSSLFFFLACPWLFIANDRGHQNHPPICFKEKMDHLLSAQLPADKLYYFCFYYV
jgi:hypothetical protein